MKLKTATLLAIVGTAGALVGNMIYLVRNLALAGHVPVIALVSCVLSALFHISLIIFLVTLCRKQ